MSDLEGSINTDLSNAERFATRYNNKLAYCDQIGWLEWDDQRWARSNHAHIVAAKRTAIGIYSEADNPSLPKETRDTIVAWAKTSESQQRLFAMAKLAESDRRIRVDHAKLDANPMLLNVKNGVVDLRDNTLKSHLPELYLTKLANARYNKAATCPLWLDFLDRIFAGNQRLIKFIQRSVGYSLTGDASEKIFFLVYGSTDTGKSTFINTIQKLLGDYALTTPAATFMTKNGNTASNDIARLMGARFVCAIESEANQRMATAVVKAMTGKDKLAARFLFKEYFDFVPQFKTWLATNHKPKINSEDDAMWRRVKLIPFEVQIPQSEQDAHFTEKLAAEIDGILMWALEGCADWQRNGLQVPDEIVSATREYQAEQDTIAQAFDECFISKRGCVTKSSDLYLKYSDWCYQNHETPEKQNTFGRWLTDHGFASEKQGGGQAVRKGIALLA